MKHTILFALTTATLLSCGSDTKPAQQEQAAAPAIHFKTLSAPVPFAGYWISDVYLHDIQAHQSPRKAQQNIDECFIRIPENTLRPTTMVINFHEGYSDLVTVNNNGAFQLWEKQNDTLALLKYSIENISADKIKIGDKPFTRINIESTGDQPRILEEILFKGVYESKKGERVEFKNNGEVSGLGKYKYYTPVIDYFDAGLQIDQVGLGETKDNPTYFGFKFKKDKLDLYSLKCTEYDNVDKRCVEVSYGEKMHELRKNDPQ